MYSNRLFKLSESIYKGFPKANIDKWVTKDDHEDIVLKTKDAVIELKVYPNKENLSE